MREYEFSLVLKGSLKLTEEIADELFEAGCDDGTPGTCDGVFSIDFHREADTLEAAETRGEARTASAQGADTLEAPEARRAAPTEP